MNEIIMGTHVFNEQKKRLDPIDNTCMCCGKNFSIGEKSNFYIPIFKEKDRTNVIVYRNVKFQRLNIGVSRCPACKEKHKRIQPLSILVGLLVGLGAAGLSLGLGWLLAEFFNLMFIFIVFVALGVGLGIFLGFSFYYRQLNKMSIKSGILSERDAASQYELVQSLLNDGWTFDQPIA